MPKAESPPGDPVFTAQVQWEGTTLIVGVFGGSSVAVQHVEKLLHNDFQLGRRHIRAVYVRRWELDRPNADPETNGEQELVHSKVAPTYHVGDPCPCEYCRNSIPRGGNGGIPPREYADLPIPHPQPDPEPEPVPTAIIVRTEPDYDPNPGDIPEPRSCQWCRVILPETSTEHFCSDACRGEAMESCRSDSEEEDVREMIHEDRNLCTMCGSPQGPNGCSYCDGPINPGDTDDAPAEPPMYAPMPELVAAGVASGTLDLYDCE